MTPTPASRFATGAIVAAVPLLLLWWVTADGIAMTLRPAVSQLARLLMPIGAVMPDGHDGWRVETTLLVTEGFEATTYDITARVLRRLSLSWPLLLALLLAPPRPPRLAARLAVALAILAVLFTAGACVQVSRDLLKYARVVWPAYGEVVFFVGKLGLYAFGYFQPFVAPPLVWLALNPRARAIFLWAPVRGD